MTKQRYKGRDVQKYEGEKAHKTWTGPPVVNVVLVSSSSAAADVYRCFLGF